MSLVSYKHYCINAETDELKVFNGFISIYREFVIERIWNGIKVYDKSFTFLFNIEMFDTEFFLSGQYVYRHGIIYKINFELRELMEFYILKPSEQIVSANIFRDSSCITVIDDDIFYKIDYEDGGEDIWILHDSILVIQEIDYCLCIDYKYNFFRNVKGTPIYIDAMVKVYSKEESTYMKVEGQKAEEIGDIDLIYGNKGYDIYSNTLIVYDFSDKIPQLPPK